MPNEPYVEQIMVADGDGDNPDVEEVKYETVHDGGGGGGTNLDSLPDSTNDISDTDLIVSKENNGWVKKTALKLLQYIGIFYGTTAEWETLTTAEKDKYRLVIFTDDNANPFIGVTSIKGNNESTYRTGDVNLKIGDIINTGTADGTYLDKSGNWDVPKVNFTSGDSTDANATSWTSVTKVDDNLSLATLFNRVTTMMKNVRYLYKHSPQVVDAYAKTISLTCSAGWTRDYSLGITLTSGLYLMFITCSLTGTDTQLAFDITNFIGLGFDKSNANYPSFTICSYGRIASDNTALKAAIWSTHARSNESVTFRFIRLSKII